MSINNRLRLVAALVSSVVAMLLIIASCNLGAAPDAAVDLTSLPTDTPTLPTRTPITAGQAATVTPIPFPTRIPGQVVPPRVVPTLAAVLPPVVVFPTSTPAPISIFILSPTSGNIVAGNIQVLGSASHPQFLQYRLEYGPDPNPNNLWFPITGIVQAPVINSVLGIWNTTTPATPDGTYQLRLRVFLRDGRQEVTTVNAIRVQNRAATPVPTSTPNVPRPIAAFTQDVTTGNAPLTVRFTNQSQGQITGVQWFFGDGSTSNQPNPAHTYTRAGIYTITLQVTGPGGTSNVSRQLTVTGINPPIAAFDASTVSGPAPLTVNFINRSSGNITAYNWDFGDGATSTLVSPSHTFTTVGTYNVILQVTGQGGVSTVVRQVTVSNPLVPAPVAAFTPNPATGQTPLTVTFNNTTTGTVTQTLWDFNGDGITDSVDPSPTHQYTTAGTFTVSLVAIGPGGQSRAQAQVQVQAPPQAPIAAFTANPTSGTRPLTVQFTNATTGDATFVWDFQNDGTPDSTDANPTFTFNEAGTYVVRLTASGLGGSTTAEATISVANPLAPPQASFTANPPSGDRPLTVVFTNTSQGDTLAFSWDFNGDGTTDSTDPNPSFTFNTAGSYTVSLVASNSAGTHSATQTIQVTEPIVVMPPVAAFVASTTAGVAPLTVTFTNTSTGEGNTFAWDFNGDGTVDSTDASPTFVFTSSGTYNVSLTATNTSGSSIASQSIVVAPQPEQPVPSFTVNPTSGTAPLTVTVQNTTPQTVDTIEWDFTGDGVTDATGSIASFTYDAPGIYTITLTVVNAGGRNQTAQNVTVDAPLARPIASFDAIPASGTAPLTVTFTSTSSGTITSHAWDVDGIAGVDNTSAGPVTFTYNTPGTYTVTLVVANDAGSDTMSQVIQVAAPQAAPVASFTTSTLSGTAPLTVDFTLTTPDVLTSFSWDFNGDGVVDNTVDRAPSFTFDIPGTYNVTLTVTNEAGTDIETQTITVNAALPPLEADFTADPTQGDVPLTVAFNVTTPDPIGTISWDFNGDGIPDNTTDRSTTFTYQTAGTYTALLTLTRGTESSTATAIITVSDVAVPPLSNLTVTPGTGSAPLTVTFSFDPAVTGPVTSFSWDFNGDTIPDNTTDNPVQFTYDTPGDYAVTLTLTNEGGTTTATERVTVSAPAQATPSGDIVFASDRDGPFSIFRMNDDGSNPVNLTPNGTNNTAPVWTPDGRIVFVSSVGGGQSIYIMNADGTGLTRLTDGPAVDDLPAVSPDGARIAFVRNATGDNEIWVMNADGSGQTQLTFHGSDDTRPTWSGPNQIIFASNIGGNFDLFRINVDGSELTPITTDFSDEYDPDIRDGRLLFVSGREGNPDIFIANVDGTGVVRLTTSGGADFEPRWAGDGRVIFTSNRDGNNEVYLMNADGSGQANVTNSGANDRTPDRR